MGGNGFVWPFRIFINVFKSGARYFLNCSNTVINTYLIILINLFNAWCPLKTYILIEMAICVRLTIDFQGLFLKFNGEIFYRKLAHSCYCPRNNTVPDLSFYLEMNENHIVYPILSRNPF